MATTEPIKEEALPFLTFEARLKRWTGEHANGLDGLVRDAARNNPASR